MNNKRKRIPLSCLFCRTKKKKCDKRRPCCSYCLSHNNGAGCVYDVEAPVDLDELSPSSKRALEELDDIERLLYYKELFSDEQATVHNDTELEKQQTQIIELRKHIANLERSFKRHQQWDRNKNTLDPGPSSGAIIGNYETINFFQLRDPVVVHSNSITHFKPLHPVCLFRGGMFFALGHSHINTCYRVMKQCLKNERVGSDLSILSHPLASLLNEEFKTTKVLFLLWSNLNKLSLLYRTLIKLISSLYNNRKAGMTNLQIDSVKTSEDFRARLVCDIEKVLPTDVRVMHLLWKTFEKYVYPFIPILDLEAFKRDLELVITGLKLDDYSTETPAIYRINLTSFVDLGLIATFLIILRLSYTALKVNLELAIVDDPVERSICNINSLQYIGNEYINLAYSCLFQCKTLFKNSLITLAGYIYLYYYILHSEEYSSTFTECERSVLMEYVFSISLNTGVFRDWSNVFFIRDGRSHPGVDFHNQNSLVYLARKMWYTVCEMDVREFLEVGTPLSHTRTKGYKVQPPVHTLEEPDLAVAEIIDNSYVDKKKLGIVLLGLNGMFYESECKVRELYEKLVVLENGVLMDFGNPLEYFKDDRNFSEKKGPGNSTYHLVLRKVMKFETYLVSTLAQVKLGVLLVMYCENNKQHHNYAVFLKQILLLTASIAKVLVRNYVVDNVRFLKTDVDINLKNFNYKLTPLVNKIVLLIITYIGAFIFELFVCVFILANKIKTLDTNSSDLDQVKEKLRLLISLKKTCIKYFDILLKGHLYKSIRFYFQHIKQVSSHGTVFTEFCRCDRANDTGEELQLLNFYFSTTKGIKRTNKGKLQFQLQDVPETSLLLDLLAQLLNELLECVQDKDFIDLTLTELYENELYDVLNSDLVPLDEFLDIFPDSMLATFAAQLGPEHRTMAR